MNIVPIGLQSELLFTDIVNLLSTIVISAIMTEGKQIRVKRREPLWSGQAILDFQLWHGVMFYWNLMKLVTSERINSPKKDNNRITSRVSRRYSLKKNIYSNF